MMEELRKQLLKASDKLGAEDVNFENKNYLVVAANDEILDFAQQIGAINNDQYEKWA